MCREGALAEEARFELARPLRAYRFSRPAHSAALALLRGRQVSLARCGKGVKIGCGTAVHFFWATITILVALWS